MVVAVSRKIAIVIGVHLVASCGERRDPGPVDVRQPASLVVENRSQFDLLELRIHESMEYVDAQDILQDALPIGGQYVFHGSGSRYVTVFRERNRGGPIIAVSTISPLNLSPETGYGLLVFDDSFRVEAREWIALTSTRADDP